MEIGSLVVAKVTLYCAREDWQSKTITPETPAWMVGAYTDDKDWDIAGEVLLIEPPGLAEEMAAFNLKNKSDQWETLGLNRQMDEWTLVPEEEWPDEVYAALAKRALLGEG